MTKLSCVSFALLGLAAAALGGSAPAQRQLNEDTPGELSFQCCSAHGLVSAFALRALPRLLILLALVVASFAVAAHRLSESIPLN
jgi:hypothetical protein